MSARQDVAALIEERLMQALHPTALVIEDESALHAGHRGASNGGHYRVEVVAACFAGQGLLARHRLVYDTLADLMGTSIHALAIDALAPGEAKAS